MEVRRRKKTISFTASLRRVPWPGAQEWVDVVEDKVGIGKFITAYLY